MEKITVASTRLAVAFDTASAVFAVTLGHKKADFFARLYYWNSTMILGVVLAVLDFIAWHQQHHY
jgi:hypothetical protein